MWFVHEATIRFPPSQLSALILLPPPPLPLPPLLPLQLLPLLPSQTFSARQSPQVLPLSLVEGSPTYSVEVLLRLS